VAIANNFSGWGLKIACLIRRGSSGSKVTNPMAGKQWMKTRPARIALTALAWTILGCLFALPDLSSGADRRHALLLSLTLWWSWGMVTPLIFWVDRKIPVSRKQLARRVLAHFLPSLLVTAGYVYLLGAVRAVFGIGEWKGLATIRLLGDSLRGMYLWNWLDYWLILGAWQAYHYHNHYVASELRLERLERNFSEARLNALRMQLEPHFLFNALNAISSEIQDDPVCARNMIEHLGSLLRLSLDRNERQLVPLFEELSFLEHYLAIQRIRFGDRLRFEQVIDEDVRHVLVPSMLIQPLVENSTRHGLAQRATGGLVRIVAKRIDEQNIQITVEDDGAGLPVNWNPGSSFGLGLSITEQRLTALYPGKGRVFEIRRRKGGGTEVELRLPIHAAEEGRWQTEPEHA